MKLKTKVNQFIKAELKVTFDTELTRNGVAVYHALTRYMDAETHLAIVRTQKTADTIGRSRQTVRRGLSELIEKGIVIREYRYASDGHQVCSAYYIIGADAERYQVPSTKTSTLLL